MELNAQTQVDKYSHGDDVHARAVQQVAGH